MSTPAEPIASLELLRQLTDRHVLSQLLDAEALTRAEIAARTGISKPTISESMRRLERAGLVIQAGTQQGRRGRAGTYYAVPPHVGCAVALSASPDGLVAEVRDVRGKVLRRIEHPVPVPITSGQLNPRLVALVDAALQDLAIPVLASALSVAGPVEKASGRLVELPSSPFLIGEWDPRSLLGDRLPPLHIDNDVNWEALAEARTGNATDLDEFFYCHLGHGLGGAIVRDQQIAVGSGGLAGEIAHVRTRGPGGKAMRLIECFEALGLTRPGAATIDVTAVRAALSGSTAADRRCRDSILRAVAEALASAVAILNPAGLVIGGPWGREAVIRDRLPALVEDLSPVRLEVRFADLGDEGPLAGAGLAAVQVAREAVLSANAG